MFFSKKNTLTSKECESAVKLLIPGELGKMSVGEGRKALKRFSGLEWVFTFYFNEALIN